MRRSPTGTRSRVSGCSAGWRLGASSKRGLATLSFLITKPLSTISGAQLNLLVGVHFIQEHVDETLRRGHVALQRGYQIENPPVRAMPWDEYERLVGTRWRALLDSNPPLTERAVHTFLEQHPTMVPGAFNLLGGESGHYPRHSVLISQPPLPSYDRRVPDFLWLSKNSETDEPVLVEIEAPGKRWFAQSGQQTAELTQALNQIAEWKAWFSEPRNVDAFKAFYGLDREAWRGRRFRPAYLLIYGRRAEANARPDLARKRGYLHADDVVSMTYDRLRAQIQVPVNLRVQELTREAPSRWCRYRRH